MSRMYSLQQIKLALLTGFMSAKVGGNPARHTGQFRMKLDKGTPEEFEIEVDAWMWELQDKDREKWLGKSKTNKPENCPSFYMGIDDKQKKSFWMDPVEALQGEHLIDSGKGSQESSLVVEQDTTEKGRAKTRAKMEAAIRPDEIDECEKENAA